MASPWRRPGWFLEESHGFRQGFHPFLIQIRGRKQLNEVASHGFIDCKRMRNGANGHPKARTYELISFFHRHVARQQQWPSFAFLPRAWPSGLGSGPGVSACGRTGVGRAGLGRAKEPSSEASGVPSRLMPAETVDLGGRSIHLQLYRML